MNNELTRNCPECKKELVYSDKSNWHRAKRNLCLCNSCGAKRGAAKRNVVGERNPFFGKHHTDENKLKKSLDYKQRGILPPNRSGTKMSESAKKKIGMFHLGNKYSLGRKLSMQTKQKLSLSHKGKPCSESAKYKLRMLTVERLKTNKCGRSYNSVACDFMDNLNAMLGIKLQHAKHGDEIQLYGYFVDGYDKEKNIIFEYDEPYHNGLSQLNKDLIRQTNLFREIKPTLFLRYDEQNKRLYDADTKSEISI